MENLLIISDFCSLISYLFKWKTMGKSVLRFFRYYFYPPIRIVIFGESGSGKSQLICALTNSKNSNIGRTRNIEKKYFRLPSGRRVALIDSPGHSTYQAQRYNLGDQIKAKKIRGIINVVSYGYCEADTAQDVSVFKTGENVVKEEYLNINRKKEVAQLDDWSRYVDGKNTAWIITLINKADIWHNKREDVLNYYENASPYAEKLSNYKNCCTLHTFEYCSIIAPFCDRPMVISIGEREKEKLHNTFIVELQKIIQQNGRI